MLEIFLVLVDELFNKSSELAGPVEEKTLLLKKVVLNIDIAPKLT